MRIIIEMDVDYWSDELRKEVMQYLIHQCKVVTTDEDYNDHSEFKGKIFEFEDGLKFPLTKNKEYDIEW